MLFLDCLILYIMMDNQIISYPSVSEAISLAFIKMREETVQYLNHNHLDNWTVQKAMQKILESNRVDKETKDMIRNMKKKRNYE